MRATRTHPHRSGAEAVSQLQLDIPLPRAGKLPPRAATLPDSEVSPTDEFNRRRHEVLGVVRAGNLQQQQDLDNLDTILGMRWSAPATLKRLLWRDSLGAGDRPQEVLWEADNP